MTKWPSFKTNDIDLDTVAGSDEMERRWEKYDRGMKAVIAAGGVHQDADGWWVDDATGELIGPDPSIEKVGRPKSDDPKQIVIIRLDRDVLERLKAEGAGWQTRINTILRKATGLS